MGCWEYAIALYCVANAMLGSQLIVFMLVLAPNPIRIVGHLITHHMHMWCAHCTACSTSERAHRQPYDIQQRHPAVAMLQQELVCVGHAKALQRRCC